ncbi:MAG: hypothetical protein GX625_19810 [Clostridiaceae bacterium]|nr:hypothetical protein [Clostridiaceae bacterium]
MQLGEARYERVMKFVSMAVRAAEMLYADGARGAEKKGVRGIVCARARVYGGCRAVGRDDRIRGSKTPIISTQREIRFGGSFFICKNI